MRNEKIKQTMSRILKKCFLSKEIFCEKLSVGETSDITKVVGKNDTKTSSCS